MLDIEVILRGGETAIERRARQGDKSALRSLDALHDCFRTIGRREATCTVCGLVLIGTEQLGAVAIGSTRGSTTGVAVCDLCIDRYKGRIEQHARRVFGQQRLVDRGITGRMASRGHRA